MAFSSSMAFSHFPPARRSRFRSIFPLGTKVVVKEIRFGPQTDDHDYNFKLKHAQSFLQEGSKVKAYVFFKGRDTYIARQQLFEYREAATFSLTEGIPRLWL